MGEEAESKKEKNEGRINPNTCQECLKNGRGNVTMTRRDQKSLECPKCHCWKLDPQWNETKEEKVKRLEAELAAARMS